MSENFVFPIRSGDTEKRKEKTCVLSICGNQAYCVS